MLIRHQMTFQSNPSAEPKRDVFQKPLCICLAVRHEAAPAWPMWGCSCHDLQRWGALAVITPSTLICGNTQSCCLKLVNQLSVKPQNAGDLGLDLLSNTSSLSPLGAPSSLPFAGELALQDDRSLIVYFWPISQNSCNCIAWYPALGNPEIGPALDGVQKLRSRLIFVYECLSWACSAQYRAHEPQQPLLGLLSSAILEPMLID